MFSILCNICGRETTTESIDSLIINISLIPSDKNLNIKYIQQPEDSKNTNDDMRFNSSFPILENKIGRYSLPFDYNLKNNLNKGNINRKVKDNAACPSLCNYHSKEFVAYCENDKTLLCIKCMLEKKRDEYKYYDLDEAYAIETKSILQKEDQIKFNEKKLLEEKEAIENIEKEINEINLKSLMELDRIYGIFNSIVEQTLLKSKEKIDNIYIDQCMKIQNRRNEIDKFLYSDIINIKEEINKIKNNNIQKVEFLTSLHYMKDNLNKLFSEERNIFSNDWINSESFINIGGQFIQELKQAIFPHETKEVDELFKNIIMRFPDYQSLAYLNRNGEDIACDRNKNKNITIPPIKLNNNSNNLFEADLENKSYHRDESNSKTKSTIKIPLEEYDQNEEFEVIKVEKTSDLIKPCFYKQAMGNIYTESSNSYFTII